MKALKRVIEHERPAVPRVTNNETLQAKSNRSVETTLGTYEVVFRRNFYMIIIGLSLGPILRAAQRAPDMNGPSLLFPLRMHGRSWERPVSLHLTAQVNFEVSGGIYSTRLR